MEVQNITMKSRIIFSKLLFNMMNKSLPSNDELLQKAEIEYHKKKLREEYSELQEKFAASLVSGNVLREEMKLYNFKLIKLELKFYNVQSSINKKELYYKRLEILHDILNNNEEETFINTNDLYQQLIEAIKDEVINELEIKLNIARLILQANVYNKELSKEEEGKYRDQIYDIQVEIKELKKVLKIDKLDEIKEVPFDKLVNDSSYNLLNNLYQEEIYGKKSK